MFYATLQNNTNSYITLQNNTNSYILCKTYLFSLKVYFDFLLFLVK